MYGRFWPIAAPRGAVAERPLLVKADVRIGATWQSTHEWLLYPGDLNRSMQHLDSKNRDEDVADEAKTKDLLQRRTKKLDVGSLAEG